MDGFVLKDIRYIADFTQQQLGQLIGISQSAITQMESGAIAISDTTRRKIIEILASENIGQEGIYLLSELKNKR